MFAMQPKNAHREILPHGRMRAGHRGHANPQRVREKSLARPAAASGASIFANGAMTAVFQEMAESATEQYAARQARNDRIAQADALADAYMAGHPVNMNDEVAFEWPSAPQGLVDFSAGLGDGVYSGITFGRGNLQDVRDLFGIDGGINKSSAMYQYSNGAGEAVGMVALGGSALGELSRVAQVRAGAQTMMLSLQLMTGAGDLTTYMGGGVSLQEQLSALVEMQQDAAAEEAIIPVK